MVVRTKEVQDRPQYESPRSTHDTTIMVRPRPLSPVGEVLRMFQAYDANLDLVLNPIINRWELWRLRRGRNHLNAEKDFPLMHYYNTYTYVSKFQWPDGSYMQPSPSHVAMLRKHDWGKKGINEMEKEFLERDIATEREKANTERDMARTLARDVNRYDKQRHFLTRS